MTIKTIRNNKKILLITVISFVVILTLILSTSLAKYQTTQSIKIVEGTINYKLADLNMIAMYQKNSSGTYDEISVMPSSGYAINESMSYCTINGEKDNNVTIKTVDGYHGFINAQKGSKCYLYFDNQPLTASEQIIALAGNGQVFNEGTVGYRYEGKNVNNYVEFNNETWRILAVEEGSRIGQTSGEYYIKLISENYLGGSSIKWDTSSGIDWSKSSLYKTLNTTYLMRLSTYSSTGLSENARSQIVTANWYTGTASGTTYTASEYYNYERSSSTNFVHNYIGLIYLSDYGYASPTSTCGSTKFYQFSSSGCSGINWLFTNITLWTLVKSSTQLYVIPGGTSFSSGGDVGATSSSNSGYARPCVYLKSDIKFVEGTTGTSSNMFKIA